MGYFCHSEQILQHGHLEAKLQHLIRKFLADEAGATAIEYGLIAAGISLAIISVVKTVGTTLSGVFNSINSKLPGASQ